MNILAVDPGTNYCGMSILTIDDNTLSLNNIHSQLIDLTHIDDGLFNRLNELYNTFYHLTDIYRPIWLAIESSFINRFRPAAVIPISKSIYAIEKAYYDVTNSTNITELPPLYVKNIVTSYGLASKDNVKEAILNIAELENLYIPDNLSEHEYDSIAIGYAWYKQFIKNPELLLWSL